jgi:hypothetical protein
MNLDELRTALREPAPVPLSVSLDRVVARGRLRRAVRRATLPAVAVATAAAVAVPVTLLGGEGAAPPAAPPSPATATASRAPIPGPLPPASVTVPWGDVVRTGERVEGTERVFWFWRLSPVRSPAGVTFGIAAGHLTAAGDRVLDTSTNDGDGPDDRSSGFHGGSFDRFTGPRLDVWLVYGYYVGPVDRVVVSYGGSEVRARTARWSKDPSVTLYWVAAGAGVQRPGDRAAITLAAYDAAGERLPAGDTFVLTPPGPAVPRR